MSRFLEKSIDEKQYDNLDWSKDGGVNTPQRLFFRRQLLGHIKAKFFQDKKVLDVGAGMGFFSNLFTQLGAIVTSIEPSEKNRLSFQDNYPNNIILDDTLQSFETNDIFNIVFTSFVFEHIHELKESFEKIFHFLDNGGVWIVFISNPSYAKKQKFNYDISVEETSSNYSLVRTKRASGVMYDVIHDIDYFIQTAIDVGFDLENSHDCFADEQLIEDLPKYADIPELALAKLLIFKKRI